MALPNPRILLLSQRNINESVYYRSGVYEFEDIVCQVDSVDLLAPRSKSWFKYGTRIAQHVTRKVGLPLDPGLHKIKIDKEYALFFTIVQFPRDLLNINSVRGWKEHCKTSVCWLNEVWASEVSQYRNYLKILSGFDYVIINLAGSVRTVQQAIQSRCVYLPGGVDALLFCPYPDNPKRVIDVLSIGRRSEKTHQALLMLARENGTFYVYDTRLGEQISSTTDHRLLLANMAKRTKYFIVNPAKIDRPCETGGQGEVGSRYFEGAAAGTIMIGEYPTTEEWRKLFDWPDVVIHLPFGSEKIRAVIDELEEDVHRQEDIRKTNVVASLMRHDWMYRWESLLRIAGLEPLPVLMNRRVRLGELSRMVMDSEGESV